MTRDSPAARWGFAAAVAVVIVLGAAFCGVAAWLGRRRWYDATFYFYELVEVGHPGVVNMVTAMGFVSAAIISGLLSTSRSYTARQRLAWRATGVLLVTVGFDDLLHAHNQLPGGDVISRVIYWAMLLVVIRTLRPAVRGRGSSTIVLALVLFAASEVIDLFTPGDDPTFRYHELFSVTEEAAALIGAWVLTVALIGVASLLISATDPTLGAQSDRVGEHVA